MRIRRLVVVFLAGAGMIFGCAQPERTSSDDAQDYDSSPAWSPDGTKIAYASFKAGKRDIFIMDADGSNQTQITVTESDESTPAWSPDGTRIAICSTRDGNEEIYLIDPDGSNPVNLTNHPSDDCNPGWSPDGTKILFMTTRDGNWQVEREENWELYVMGADGSRQERLTHTPGYELTTGQAWSPDGNRIVFCSTGDKKFVKGPDQFDDFDLYIMDADGSNVRKLTFTEGQDSYAYWSPDGRKISYTHVDKDAPIEASGGENYEIYVINPDGTGMTRLTNNLGYDFEGWWSPDSRKMVYSSSEENPLAIYVMEADGSNRERLTSK